MDVPIQTRVLSVLKNYAKGATANFVAQTLGVPPDQAAQVLEGLYLSSRVECLRLGVSINVYRLTGN